jgi:BirA family biotin operon repressor/biotin-[acetyl-CoA-carboxylase] ligase
LLICPGIIALNELDMKLLSLIADGGFHSGTALGKELGITRAAVWQHIQHLLSLGLRIDALSGKGYRLSQRLDLLDSDGILSQIQASAHQKISKIAILPCVDSTNNYLRKQPHSGQGVSICLAEFQSNGRGRMGRSWISPFASNIYLSIAWQFAHGSERLAGFSLVVALAIVRALKRLGLQSAGIKWPNDVLWNRAKLAGVLIEASGEMHGPTHVVLGLGLNVNMPAHAANNIDQPWTDLSHAKISVPRNKIAAYLIEELLQIITTFGEHGFPHFMDEWAKYDLCLNHHVSIAGSGNTHYEGIARGVDATGLLLLEQSDGIKAYASGDVHLRIADNEATA